MKRRWTRGDVTRAWQDDELLFAAHRCGDPVATERLFVSMRRRIAHAAVTFLPETQDTLDIADDLAQETLIRMATHLSQCHAVSLAQFVAWSIMILRHVLSDQRQTPSFLAAPERCRLDEALDVAAPIASEGECEAEDEGSRVQTPREFIRDACIAAINTLSDDALAVVQIRVIGGASWAETGSRLNTTEAAAKRRFQRATARVRAWTARAVRVAPGEIAERARRRLDCWAGSRTPQHDTRLSYDVLTPGATSQEEVHRIVGHTRHIAVPAEAALTRRRW